MAQYTIAFDNLDLELVETETGLETQMLVAQTNIHDKATLHLLEKKDTLLVDMEAEEAKGEIKLRFADISGLKHWETSQKLAQVDKFRLCLNLCQYEKFIEWRQTPVLAPENMLFDINLMPKMLYRGLKDYVEPMEITTEDFLRQLKSLVIATLTDKLNFYQLYEGALAIAKQTPLIREIAQANSVQEVQQLLEKAYLREKEYIEHKLKLVPKGRFKLYFRLLLAMALIAFLFASVVVYFATVTFPFQNMLLETNKYYMASDYNNVINKTSKTAPEKLPQTTKYQVAFAYLVGEKALNESQKNFIFSQFSLKNDPKFLEYWIYNGRGAYEKSLDIAQTLNDIDLEAFALEKNIESLNINTKISGKEKQEKLKTFETSLQELKEKKAKAMNPEQNIENQVG